MFARSIPILAAVFLAGMLAYLAGMWTTYRSWWPWQKALEVQDGLRSWRATGGLHPSVTYAHRRASAPDERYTVNDAGAISPGYWAINRYDPVAKVYVFDLIDETGTVLNSFPLDYSKIGEKGGAEAYVHTATVLPDGTVLVQWDAVPGLARLDACGDPIWARTDQIYHHSLERGQDGYWGWTSAEWDGGQYQEIYRVDPMTGDIVEKISLIDDVIEKSTENGLRLTVPEGNKFDRDAALREEGDLFHPNDVDELLPEMAAAFPQFEPGDLLVSLRNTDTVAVIGRKTGEVKWSAYGPWRMQHDPDFQPDGTISIFSNNTERTRSQILSVDPKTGITRDLFAGTDLVFSSYIMGKHQHLPNGNWLIVSTIEGRVMEVSPAGHIVREYNNILNDGYNALTAYAEHIAPGYLSQVPKCAK